MSQNSNKIFQTLSSELQFNIRQKEFDVKLIPTFGVFRPSQLQAIGSMQIREQFLKQLITNVLKLCYLYDPIIKTLRQMQKMQDVYYYNPNNFLKVGLILHILSENLFYSNMTKLKVDSSDTVIHLVNNRPTQLNRRVIIAGILVYIAKRLSLEEIGTALLVFNLEEALFKLRPFGLLLDHNLLQKCIRKINRVANINDLKIFLQTVKQQGQELTQKDRQDITNNIKMLRDSQFNIKIPKQNLKYLLGPDQFLYLVALSERRSNSSFVFSNNFGMCAQFSHKKLGIDAFMMQKKLQYTSSNQIQNNNYISNNSEVKQKKIDNLNETETQSIHYNCPVKEKVRGLSLYSSHSEQIKAIRNYDQLYKQIKIHIKNKNNKENYHPKILSSNINSEKKQNQQRSKSQLRYNNQYNSLKEKNSLLIKQRVKSRPQSSIAFRNSLKIMQKNEQMANFFNKSLKVSQIITNLHKRSKTLYISKNQTCQKQKQGIQVAKNNQNSQKENKNLRQQPKLQQKSKVIIKQTQFQAYTNNDPLFVLINRAFNEHYDILTKSTNNLYSQIQSNVENHFISAPSSALKKTRRFSKSQNQDQKIRAKSNLKLTTVSNNNFVKSNKDLVQRFGRNQIQNNLNNINKNNKNKVQKIIKFNTKELKILAKI